MRLKMKKKDELILFIIAFIIIFFSILAKPINNLDEITISLEILQMD